MTFVPFGFGRAATSLLVDEALLQNELLFDWSIIQTEHTDLKVQ
jgi:hypothetical protein